MFFCMEKVVLIFLLVAAVVPGFANDSLVTILEADSLPGFGSLRISPILQSGVGAEDELRIEIDGKPENGMEFSLLSGNHSVVIRHRCYETVYFDVDMLKDGVRELNIPLRVVQGALDLRSIENDEPKLAPVFVNDFKVGETPLVEIVPICSKVTIGENRNAVPVTLKKNEVVRYTHNLGGSDLFSSIEIHDSDSESGRANASPSNVGADVDGAVDLVDERDGQVYKTVKVGDRVWMAQNLNYNVAGSYCYENESSNCERFGRLYEWSAAVALAPLVGACRHCMTWKFYYPMREAIISEA